MQGESLAILGENGSGKSTLLKLLLNELRAESGKIRIFGQDNDKEESYEKIGYLPQIQNLNSMSFPVTVMEIVVSSLYRDMGFIKIPRKKHHERVREILKTLDIEEYEKTPFNRLSGGLKQRVMIARAMINKPEILILDEPTSGVDKKSKSEFLDLISEINKKSKLTILIVTHEYDLISEKLNPDKVYKMDEGKLVELTRGDN